MKISIYDIEDKPIGRGGMGLVYSGTDPQGNKIAVKEMPAQHVSDPGLRKRFHQEVAILSQLEHPFIVKMYASFEERGNLYLVMEYVEGETIEQYIKRNGIISEKRAANLIIDILSALNCVHQKEYVHRDIKPSNIMIRSNGNICLLDFGIAKDMKRNKDALTAISMTIGTVGYMSPEQAEGLSIDHRSDIYSLGCVLFYMLTGQHAIKEKSNEIATRVAIINESFPKAIDFNANLSHDIQQILNTATNKSMLLRFQSCDEFDAELRKLIIKKNPDNPDSNDSQKELWTQLNVAQKQLDILKKSKKKHRVAWIVLLIISMILFVMTINSFNKVDSLEYDLTTQRRRLSTEVDNKENEISSLENNLVTLKSQLSEIQKFLPFKIDGIEIGNLNGDIINDYGSILYASNIRFLSPKIYYTSFLENSQTFTIYYKIYNPDGSLNYNKSYSTIYTGDGNTETIYSGSNSTILKGWGNESASIYSSGIYRIEIWSNDMCLKTEKFKIN